MKKINFKLTSRILLACVCLGFVACSSDKDDDYEDLIGKTSDKDLQWLLNPDMPDGTIFKVDKLDEFHNNGKKIVYNPETYYSPDPIESYKLRVKDGKLYTNYIFPLIGLPYPESDFYWAWRIYLKRNNKLLQDVDLYYQPEINLDGDIKTIQAYKRKLEIRGLSKDRMVLYYNFIETYQLIYMKREDGNFAPEGSLYFDSKKAMYQGMVDRMRQHFGTSKLDMRSNEINPECPPGEHKPYIVDLDEFEAEYCR